MLLLSRQPRDNLRLRDGIRHVQSIDEAVSIAHEQGFRDVWIDGGATIRAFLQRKLVSEMVLSTIPIALGKGLPLFEGIERDIKFEIVASEVLGNLLATKYRVEYSQD